MFRNLFLVLSLALLPFNGAQAGHYAEIPDAGDQFNPQAITPTSPDFSGSNFSGIDGNIGGDGDPYDAFLFYFSGVDFDSNPASFRGTSTYEGSGDLILELFRASDPSTRIAFGTKDIIATGLGAGNYILGFATSAAADPLFSFSLSEGIAIQAPVSVPEPGSLAMMGIGLAGLGQYRRRQVRKQG